MGAASELQLSLIGFAVVLVVAVWLYNQWQERRQRRAARQLFGGESGPRGDPLAGAIAAQDSREPGGGQRIEPIIGSVSLDDGGDPPLELADPGIDCLVRLTPREELAAPVFWQAQHQFLLAIGDDLRWLAYHHGQWRQLGPHDAGACAAVVAAVQLADRGGPLGEVALTRLLAGTTELAAAIGAEARLPAADEVLAKCHELDRFCASVDWLIALQLVRADAGALDGARLRARLQADGFRETADGAVLAVDASGRTQFVITASDGSPVLADQLRSGLSLSIDVPLVAEGLAAFDRLLEFARGLIVEQQAQLVDEQRVPLTDPALAAIRAKIAEFQEKMAAAEIPAGGRRAQRLYA